MSFYNGGFKGIFTKAINGINLMPFELTDNMYLMTNITPIPTGRGAGTQLESVATNTSAVLLTTGLETVKGDSYYRDVTVKYSRLDLGVLFKGIAIIWETTATSTADFATWANEALGLPLAPSDLVATPLSPTNNNTYITIQAATTSPWIIGKISVYYTRGKPNIGDLIPNDWESGVYGPLSKLDMYRNMTYYKDYSSEGLVIQRILTASGMQYPVGANYAYDVSVANRQLLWGVLAGDLPYALGNTNRAVDIIAITGSSNVVAYGGRSGFNRLAHIPTLNMWVHWNYQS